MLKFTFWIVYFLDQLVAVLKNPTGIFSDFVTRQTKKILIPKRFMDAGYDQLRSEAIMATIFVTFIFLAPVGFVLILVLNAVAGTFGLIIGILCILMVFTMFMVDSIESGEYCYGKGSYDYDREAEFELLSKSFADIYNEWKEKKFK